MGSGRIRASLIGGLLALLFALGASGCGSSSDYKGTPPAAQSPPACASEPLGHAADGVNDEQGGSTPGTNPCDGPGT